MSDGAVRSVTLSKWGWPNHQGTVVATFLKKKVHVTVGRYGIPGEEMLRGVDRFFDIPKPVLHIGITYESRIN